MAIAISETMQTPPTSEPAIRESCCPNSDLYSSGNRHVTAVCSVTVATAANPEQHTRTQPNIPREGKIRARQCLLGFFFFVPPVAHEVTFARLILRRNSGPHTGSQSRAEFNYFTARFSLSLSLSNSCTLFPLHCRNSSRPLAPAQRKISKKKKKMTHLPSVRVWKSMSLL